MNKSCFRKTFHCWRCVISLLLLLVWQQGEKTFWVIESGKNCSQSRKLRIVYSNPSVDLLSSFVSITSLTLFWKQDIWKYVNVRVDKEIVVGIKHKLRRDAFIEVKSFPFTHNTHHRLSCQAAKQTFHLILHLQHSAFQFHSASDKSLLVSDPVRDDASCTSCSRP